MGRHLCLLAWCALVSDLSAQRRVWVVDQGGGPGVDFTEIQPAVDAAAAGDRVEVRWSSPFSPYQAFTLTKGLDVEARQGAFVTTCAVKNLPASEWARLAGFTVQGDNFFAGSTCIEVAQCRGPVLLASLSVTPFWLNGMGITIADADAVLIVDSVVAGASKQPHGSAGMSIERSAVALQRCRLQGGSGANAQLPQAAGSGGAGMFTTSSLVLAAASSFQGGDGGLGRDLGPWGCQPSGNGGTGASTDGDTLFMAGCTFAAGKAGPLPNPSCLLAVDGAAVESRGTPARVTADCMIQGSTRNITTLPPLPFVHSPGVAVRGSPVTLTFKATPNTVILLDLDRIHGFVPVPGIEGPALVTASAIPLNSVLVGGSGSTPLTMQVPADTALADRHVFFQGIAFEPGKPLPSLTNAADLRCR